MSGVRLVSPAFRPAAAELLEGPPRLPPTERVIRVEDSDAGPLLTDAADGVVGHTIRSTQTWEPGEGRFLQRTLRPGMHVIDVGAHIGYFTRFMARLVGAAGRVLAVEADPETFQFLRANVALAEHDIIEMAPVAASRRPGLTHGVRDPGNQGGSAAYITTIGAEAFPVQAVRLDDLLDPGARIDFIKIDAEGMDLAVVEGLRRTIGRWRPTLLVELNPSKSEQFGDPPEMVLAAYRTLGLGVRLLGADAVRLRHEAGMELDPLLNEDLFVTGELDAELIARTRHIHFINLVLTPTPAIDESFAVPS
ncbi:MAG: FkbM family methyltransferase [Thermomicrobiales bacterium]